MVDAAIVVSYLTMATGLTISYYFTKHRQTWSAMFGIVILFTGIVFALSAYSLVGTTVFRALTTSASFALFVLLYLASGRSRRAFLLFALPVLLVIQNYVYPLQLPLAVLFYAALTGAILGAHDYSAADVTLCMRNADKYLKASLWPFSTVQRIVKGAVRHRPSRAILAIVYFTLIVSMTILAPLLIAELSNSFFPPEFLMALSLAFVYVSNEELSRGLSRHENGQSRAQ